MVTAAVSVYLDHYWQRSTVSTWMHYDFDNWILGKVFLLIVSMTLDLLSKEEKLEFIFFFFNLSYHLLLVMFS